MRKNLFVRPSLEVLGDRITPVAGLTRTGVLVVRGTNYADTIRVMENPGANATVVDINGVQASFRTSDIGRIDAYGYSGDDTIDLSAVITKPSRLYGGNGHDTLIGGGQRDLLYGQYGNDVLRGGPGYDYFHGGPGYNTSFRGDHDQGVWYSYVNFDETDGPASLKPTLQYLPGLPGQTYNANASAAGNYTSLGMYVYSPEFNPVTVHSITIKGDFSGATSLSVVRSSTTDTQNASLLVPYSSIKTNLDGSRTIFFKTPVTISSQQAMQFQVRFGHGANSLPVDLDLQSVEIAGPSANVEYLFRIRWNV